MRRTKQERTKSMNENMWDVSVLDSNGNILYENFDFDTEQNARDAGMDYVTENNITDYTLDVSQPDC